MTRSSTTWDGLLGIAKDRLRLQQELVRLAEAEVEVLERLPGRESVNDTGGVTGHPKLISVKEFAERIGVSHDLVERQCRNDTIPHVRIGRRIRIPEDAITVMLGEKGWTRSKP